MTNCKNCGAPLPANGKCEYCGTRHGEDEYLIQVDFDRGDAQKLFADLEAMLKRETAIRLYPYY